MVVLVPTTVAPQNVFFMLLVLRKEIGDTGRKLTEFPSPSCQTLQVVFSSKSISPTHTHTHTHIYIYIYIYTHTHYISFHSAIALTLTLFFRGTHLRKAVSSLSITGHSLLQRNVCFLRHPKVLQPLGVCEAGNDHIPPFGGSVERPDRQFAAAILQRENHLKRMHSIKVNNDIITTFYRWTIVYELASKLAIATITIPSYTIP